MTERLQRPLVIGWLVPHPPRYTSSESVGSLKLGSAFPFAGCLCFSVSQYLHLSLRLAGPSLACTDVATVDYLSRCDELTRSRQTNSPRSTTRWNILVNSGGDSSENFGDSMSSSLAAVHRVHVPSGPVGRCSREETLYNLRQGTALLSEPFLAPLCLSGFACFLFTLRRTTQKAISAPFFLHSSV